MEGALLHADVESEHYVQPVQECLERQIEIDSSGTHYDHLLLCRLVPRLFQGRPLAFWRGWPLCVSLIGALALALLGLPSLVEEHHQQVVQPQRTGYERKIHWSCSPLSRLVYRCGEVDCCYFCIHRERFVQAGSVPLERLRRRSTNRARCSARQITASRAARRCWRAMSTPTAVVCRFRSAARLAAFSSLRR